MAGMVTGSKGLTVEVVNLDKVVSAFGALGPQIASAAMVAAKAEARVIFPMTQARVPVRSGELQASGRVEDSVGDEGSDEITVGIAYGGPAGVANNTTDVEYALIVHEDLNAVHLTVHEGGKSLVISRGQRGAKYVEGPVREELDSGRSADRMGAIIRARMGW